MLLCRSRGSTESTDHSLKSLNALRNEHQDDAKDLQTDGGGVTGARVRVENTPVCDMKHGTIRHSYKNEGEEDHDQRPPLGLVQWLL